jgi:acetoin utilization deacetylase AcuC-like enzyme
VADRFKPDVVLVSAGFDSRVDDLLGCFRFTDEGFRSMTRIVADIAQRHCGGRLVSCLEGGYNIAGLASAAIAHTAALVEAAAAVRR